MIMISQSLWHLLEKKRSTDNRTFLDASIYVLEWMYITAHRPTEPTNAKFIIFFFFEKMRLACTDRMNVR